MSELSFAKSFLQTLDSRPIKLQADYAIDPKSLEVRASYILPRMPNAMNRAASAPAPGSTSSIKVSLKSLRNPPLDLSLPAQPTTTSILELKELVAAHIGHGLGADKIRLLYKKKPCADSKSIKDILGAEVGVKEVELSVMVMGGMPASAEEEKAKDVIMGDAAPVTQGESGLSVLEGSAFWKDLNGYLEQRIRDTDVAKEAAIIFETAWRQHQNEVS